MPNIKSAIKRVSIIEKKMNNIFHYYFLMKNIILYADGVCL